jgi:3-hydroxymyristoyl/3-hydroxydecanoyl-(acyl carrier protein) dehydratase
MLDPDFVADCPYAPSGLLIDEITEVDEAQNRIVVRVPTHDELPLTREQRVHPVRHPRHVNGALMVHLTGMAGFAHFYYVFGLRHADGWIGYAARLSSVKFRALATTAAPLSIECVCTSARRSETRIVARYSFKITQGKTLVYESEQSAMWLKVE